VDYILDPIITIASACNSVNYKIKFKRYFNKRTLAVQPNSQIDFNRY